MNFSGDLSRSGMPWLKDCRQPRRSYQECLGMPAARVNQPSELRVTEVWRAAEMPFPSRNPRNSLTWGATGIDIDAALWDYGSMGNGLPGWVISQRRDRGICEQCGDGTQETQWAGTGELICWQCCEKRRNESR